MSDDQTRNRDGLYRIQYSRRQFLKMMGLIAGAGTLASCAPQQTPTAVPTEVAAAATQPPPSGPRKGGELVYALAGDPLSLAPFGVLLGLAHNGKELGYDALCEYDKDLNIEPALAESWENEDDRTWIFKLRQGVKFHDGKDFKAEDVVYSLILGADASSVDASASSVAGFATAIESVEAVDDYTVKIVTPTPDATLLGWFAWARWSVIASKDIYEQYNPSTQINGTGPFKLVEYIPNDRVVYERNPNFWKADQPYLDKVTLKVIPDEAARIAALRAGEIDGCSTYNLDVTRPLESDPNIQIVTGVTGQTRVLQISVKNDGKPWDDIRVRQAISMAINRQDLIEKVYGGEAELCAAVPPGWGPYPLPASEVAQNPYLQFNPDRAKGLLDEAGFGDGFNIDLISVQSAEYPKLGEVIKEYLGNVGIEADLRVLEASQHSAAYREGKYELFVNAQGFRRDPVGKLTQYGQPDQAPQSLWYDYPNGWKNDKMIELYNQAVSTLDTQARVPIIQELQRLGLDESTFLFLGVPYRIDLLSKRVQDWYIDYMDFNHALRTAWVDA